MQRVERVTTSNRVTEAYVHVDPGHLPFRRAGKAGGAGKKPTVDLRHDAVVWRSHVLPEYCFPRRAQAPLCLTDGFEFSPGGAAVQRADGQRRAGTFGAALAELKQQPRKHHTACAQVLRCAGLALQDFEDVAGFQRRPDATAHGLGAVGADNQDADAACRSDVRHQLAQPVQIRFLPDLGRGPYRNIDQHVRRACGNLL
ncbi:hypothetical protein D3C87_1266030 [compost metagenome]